MISLLLEGFESAFFPCTLVLLLPGLLAAITARQESTAALAGFGFVALLIGWARFSARLDDPSNGVIALTLVGAAVVLVLPLIRRIDLVSAIGGGLAGFAAAALWLPCVGSEFGSLLGELPTRGPAGLVLMTSYVIGLLAPLIIVGAILHIIPNGMLLPVRPFMMTVGAAALLLLAAATAIGSIDRLISQLVAWSI